MMLRRRVLLIFMLSVFCFDFNESFQIVYSSIYNKQNRAERKEDQRHDRMRDWMNDNVLLLERQPGVRYQAVFNPLVPPPLLSGEGLDVSVEWASPSSGAEMLSSKCFSTQNKEAQAIFTKSFSDYYSEVLRWHEGMNNPKLFKARLVSTRGKDGTKCPRFHFDHISLRMIQSFVGPGCEYLASENGVNRCCVNGVEECETKQANDYLVDRSEADVRQALPGQALFLKGTKGSPKPAIHRSPDLLPLQGRVLLTLDAIC